VALQADLPQEPVWGQWDPGQIEQVLVNLIDNAIKYSPSGGRVVVALNVESQASGGDRAHITIRDEGIGIPSEHLPRLFAPFARAENAPAAAGMGLGLITRRSSASAPAIWAARGSGRTLVPPHAALRAAVDASQIRVGAGGMPDAGGPPSRRNHRWTQMPTDEHGSLRRVGQLCSAVVSFGATGSARLVNMAHRPTGIQPPPAAPCAGFWPRSRVRSRSPSRLRLAAGEIPRQPCSRGTNAAWLGIDWSVGR
jgi:hypothetical protein